MAVYRASWLNDSLPAQGGSMRLVGLTPEAIEAYFAERTPLTKQSLDLMVTRLVAYRRAVSNYQGMALCALARQYDHESANILEIGTAYGHSCFMIASGAPKARIITLNNPEKVWEIDAARRQLKMYKNVTVVGKLSWDYLARYVGPPLEMIFVDGDHAHIKNDLPWWNWLKVGGLFVHHDYSPAGSVRECPPVFEALNEFGAFLGRSPDVLIVDDQEIGLAGWYKQESDPDWMSEKWQPTAQPQSLELK